MKSEVIRPLDVKYGKAVLMDADDDPGRLKDAVLYLDIKTKGMSDEQYLVWLKKFDMDLDCIQEELATPEFAFLFRNRVHISGAVVVVIDMLLEQNDLLDGKGHKYIIDNPY